MANYLKLRFGREKIRAAYLVMALALLGLGGFLPYFHGKSQAEANYTTSIDIDTALMRPMIESNSLMASLEPSAPPATVIRSLNVLVTGYSSTVWETDDTPFHTASGKYVRDGFVANNLLPFGTIVRLPDLFGDKEFVVEDRMNPKAEHNYVDIWFPSRQEALEFGVVKSTRMEVLKK